MIAAALTIALCTGLILYAIYTKHDFTYCGGFIFVFSCSMIAACFLSMFYPSRILVIGITWASVLLSSIFLIYDIQLLVGGVHPRMNKYSMDDYIVAAMCIYLDIVVLFIKILRIIGKEKK